jgi:peptidoglycan/xylan/chitin deacetylase (PgdA/CDA1 family)
MDVLRLLMTRTPLQFLLRAGTRRFGRLLMYHRVVDDGCSPILRGLLSGAITCSAFRRQLDYLGRHYQVVSLNELLAQRNDPGGKVAITFDDGYADNCLHAMPLLKKRQMPATVFMIAGLMESGSGVWRDRLARTIADNGPADLKLDDGDGVKVFPFQGDYGRQMKAAEQWLHGLSAQQREAVLAGRPDVEEDRFLDVEELKELERNRIKIESHTVDHSYLPDLDKVAARRELAESRSLLEQVLESPVDLLAYPYGGYNSQIQALAREAGYRAALAADRGLMRPDTDLFAIPRIGTREAFDRFQYRIIQYYRAA